MDQLLQLSQSTLHTRMVGVAHSDRSGTVPVQQCQMGGLLYHHHCRPLCAQVPPGITSAPLLEHRKSYVSMHQRMHVSEHHVLILSDVFLLMHVVGSFRGIFQNCLWHCSFACWSCLVYSIWDSMRSTLDCCRILDQAILGSVHSSK